jgi:RNA polymerase sigma-70 factor (ECF subfamily)
MDAEDRFRRLFATAYPALRRYALNRGISDGDADDLVSEVLTIAWRRLDDVPLDDALPWLYAVAANVHRNRRRSSRRYGLMLSRMPVEAAADPHADRRYGAGDIRKAFDRLSPRDQELLRLVAWDGLTPEQAARATGCTPATFRVRLHRARTRLAGALDRLVMNSTERTVTSNYEEKPNGPART